MPKEEHKIAFEKIMKLSDEQIHYLFNKRETLLTLRPLLEPLSFEECKYVDRLFRVACLISNLREEYSSRGLLTECHNFINRVENGG